MRGTAFAVFFLFFGGFALAQEQYETRHISVSGQGNVTTIPDQAELSLGVRATSQNAQDAMTEVAIEVEKVMQVLREAGIEDGDMQTRDLSVAPRYKDREYAEIAGFEVRNVLNVLVRDLDDLPVLLGMLTGAGMNDLGDLRFSSSKERELSEEALKRAVADATRQAEIISDAAGMVLDHPIVIETGGSAAVPTMRMTAMPMADAESMPVAEGRYDVRRTVLVKFKMHPKP